MGRLPRPFPIILSSVALAHVSSITVFASASAKTIVPVLVRPTRVLDEWERDSPIPLKLDSEEEGSGGLGFRSGKFGW